MIGFSSTAAMAAGNAGDAQEKELRFHCSPVSIQDAGKNFEGYILEKVGAAGSREEFFWIMPTGTPLKHCPYGHCLLILKTLGPKELLSACMDVRTAAISRYNPAP